VEHSPHTAAESYLSKPEDIVPLLDLLVQRMQALGTTNWRQSVAFTV
jgi:hypothetical protein